MLPLNEIHLGDCLDLMAEIPDGSVDLVLCDLPYGVTNCDWDKVLDLVRLWAEYLRITKPSGAIVLTAAQPFAWRLIASQPTLFKYEWIWIKNRKTTPMLAKIRPMGGHESVLVFGRNKINYFPQFGPSSTGNKSPSGGAATRAKGYSSMVQRADYRPPANTDLVCPDTVLRFNCERGLHPNQKPVPLFEYLIRTYTQEGEIVLDNCVGSGTTAVACINTNRQFIAIERDPEIHARAEQRVAEHALARLLK